MNENFYALIACLAVATGFCTISIAKRLRKLEQDDAVSARLATPAPPAPPVKPEHVPAEVIGPFYVEQNYENGCSPYRFTVTDLRDVGQGKKPEWYVATMDDARLYANTRIELERANRSRPENSPHGI